MSNGFSRTGDGVEMVLGPLQATLLAELISQIEALLEPPPVADPLEAIVGLRAVPPAAPEDPAVARLLPDAYPNDSEAAADYRRRTSDDIRAGKRDAARRALATVPATGGRVLLDDAAVQDWLVTLTDLRLVLGARLNLTDDASAEALYDIGSQDPRRPVVEVYLFLGDLQEQLVQALL
ncbi:MULTISPECIES: DUF2017 domain-containing protein [Protofrankia]|uniref:DUF2017 domain-containing protein n=1 Tax=Protofrankia coriariae TaxID=1562887 RepID=A0ABR5F3A8_9ACTN|nr:MULTISPECIES: DUF2017 domain-containing protein [Protofrankia]KLL11118.1 hypothetical protein FrCorBMG51_13405 [Protofrankia coriariae]